jgi:hypothetical protein
MQLTVIAALFLITPQAQVPMDSAQADSDIRRLISAYYDLPEPWSPFRRTFQDIVDRYPWLTPRPAHGTRSCQGVTLEDCFGNDWSCTYSMAVDCASPLMPPRRTKLIEAMEGLAKFTGASVFVFRQRVAFALKNGEPERAHRIAETCHGEEWVCMALRGLTAHRVRPGAGALAFDSALTRAPDAVGCAWRDVSALTPSPLLSARCLGDDPLLARFWWLSDPLWSRPGNERYTEHMSRHVVTEIEREMRSRGIRYCDHGVYVAEGIPNSIEPRSKPPLRSTMERLAYMTGCRPPRVPVAITAADTVRWVTASFSYPLYLRYVHGGYSFVPDSVRLHDPLRSTANDWAVVWDQGHERLIPRERYYNLDHQTAVFRRGHQLLVVAAAALPPPLDTTPDLQPFLMLGRVHDLHLNNTPGRIDDRRVFRAAARVDSAAYLASIEVVGERVVGRARYGAPAPLLERGFGVSDIALVDTRIETDSTSLEDALLPAATLAAGTRVGVYFEVYGVMPDETLNIEIAGQPLNRSFINRVMGSLRMKSAAPPLRVRWQEGVDRTASMRVQRFFDLDTATLPSGENRVTLTVRRANGQIAQVMRQIYIRK